MDDYAYLIQAYTALYQVTFNEQYLDQARFFTERVTKDFYDEREGFFFYSAHSAESLIARKKEIFDNVIPSSNSVMARNLFHLGTLLAREEWKELAQQMVNRLAHLIESEPVYMSHWGVTALEMMNGLAEVVIVGKEADEIRAKLQQHFIPFAVTLGTTSKSELALLKDREAMRDTIYVCRNQVCQLPVHSVEEALQQITKF